VTHYEQTKAGAVMNIVCLLVLQLGINTWTYAYFNLGAFPDWVAQQRLEQAVNGSTSATPLLRLS